MAWFNEEISGLLREYAELTQITGGDVFRARNYEKAARSVRGWGDDIGQLDVTALRAIPGVGASIAAKIAEYRETGSIRALDGLRAKMPAGVLELTRVPGLGRKRALQLNRDLGVQSVDDLAAAIKAGRLDGLAGFGAKSEERIAAGIEVYRQGRERVLLDVALRTANEMVDALTPISQRCAYAGSLRRWRETIGDIDIRSEEHTSEIQSRLHLVCRLLLVKKKKCHIQSALRPQPDPLHLPQLYGCCLNSMVPFCDPHRARYKSVRHPVSTHSRATRRIQCG